MQILTDEERKAEQRKTVLALVVGLATMLAGGVIIANDPSSWINWAGGIAAIVAGVTLEEKFILRRK
ncbi:MAG: hypothetical protein Q7K26_06690 [bacterium]|nr:hypothetical protein [bacterium]